MNKTVIKKLKGELKEPEAERFTNARRPNYDGLT